MSKTVFKLWSIRSKNDFGKAQTYLSITNQLFREHQVGIAEDHHRVLREFRRTHHPAPPSREPPHNSDHEASQVRYRSCCHRKYLKRHFAYPNNTSNKGACQISTLKVAEPTGAKKEPCGIKKRTACYILFP